MSCCWCSGNSNSSILKTIIIMMYFLICLQVKNGHRKRCWCSLHGKLLIFRRNPNDQVSDFTIKCLIMLVSCYKDEITDTKPWHWDAKPSHVIASAVALIEILFNIYLFICANFLQKTINYFVVIHVPRGEIGDTRIILVVKSTYFASVKLANGRWC